MAAEDYFSGIGDDSWGDDYFENPSEFGPPIARGALADLLRKAGPRTRNGNIVWTTGRGDKLLLEEMDDSHIRNTIAYIKRKTEEWKKTRQQILNERGRDLGEYRINSMSGEAWITVLLAELDRRGLANVQ